MPHDYFIINLPNFKVLRTFKDQYLEIIVKYEGEVSCIDCHSTHLRVKDSFIRKVRHICVGNRASRLHIKSHKFKCLNCGLYFNQRFQGIYPRKRSTEKFRAEVYQRHFDGISQSRLSQRLGIGQATVERWSQDYLKFEESKQDRRIWPRVVGIDEHFFTRKKGYATTFADLSKNKVFDLRLGRSEKALGAYLRGSPGRKRVQVLLMDLSDSYRSIARKYFPKAKIVADRFHVIRLINQKFMETWKLLDPEGRRNRGLISLMRRHHKNLKLEQKIRLRRYLCGIPGLEVIYDYKQSLIKLMLMKHKNQRQCKSLIPEFLKRVQQLKSSGFETLQSLGKTLDRWKEEIVRMWRFTKTNSITEGLHNKMEELSRRAYGFRNFKNYRLKVRVYCG